MQKRKAYQEDYMFIASFQVDSYLTAYADLLPDENLRHFSYQEQDWQACPLGEIHLV